MYILFTILIVIASILLTLLVLDEHTHRCARTASNSITDAGGRQEAGRPDRHDGHRSGRELLASNIVSGMTPASSVWFEMDTGAATSDSRRRRPRLKRWLSNAARLLWTNIREQLRRREPGRDPGCGRRRLVRAVRRGGAGRRVQVRVLAGLSECFIASSVPGGASISSIASSGCPPCRPSRSTARTTCPGRPRSSRKDKPHDKVLFVHAIEPRKVSVVGARMAKNLPVSSRIIEVGQKRLW